MSARRYDVCRQQRSEAFFRDIDGYQLVQEPVSVGRRSTPIGESNDGSGPASVPRHGTRLSTLYITATAGPKQQTNTTVAGPAGPPRTGGPLCVELPVWTGRHSCAR